MKLETAQSLNSSHATIHDIQHIMENDKLRGEYIILSSGPQHYIQAGGESEPFILEYRDGRESEHYQCEKRVSRSELESALISYLSGNSSWKTQFQWQKVQLQEQKKDHKPWWKLW